MTSKWTLKGRKALITGGSKGIGKACVDEFLNLGAEVFFAARTHVEIKKKENLFFLNSDLSKNEERIKVIKQIEAKWGKLDILVNNIGTNIRKKTGDFTDEQYNKIFDTNLKTCYDMCRLAYPLLKKSSQGNIVN
ncbi:MAG: SDR family NAD(P)-dependent oxidoreductase, partial [Ignavibacteria bacterium]